MGREGAGGRGTAQLALPAPLPHRPTPTNSCSFEGDYETLLLPAPDTAGARDGPAHAGPALRIAGGKVWVGGTEARAASLSPSGVLSWPSSNTIGGGWLHCGHHASGPLLLGCLGAPVRAKPCVWGGGVGAEGLARCSPPRCHLPHPTPPLSPLHSQGGSIPAGRPFDVVCQRTGGGSVYLAPEAVDMSAAVLEAHGLAAAATVEIGTALAAAARAWAASLASL